MNETEYLSHDALGLAELVTSRQVSALELLEVAIRRIERINPGLNAVVYVMFGRARREAEEGRTAGVFAGVPHLLKDLLSWYEGEPITSGSRVYRGFVAPHDSELVARVRGTGAIVVGKTNTPEFGLTPFCESELLGPARNPWDTSRTTGGSSGGSGAAVAAGLVPMAGGGDGGGSLRIPGSCNGVFALKPTRGRVPTGPVEGDYWHGAAVEHVLTRSVRDSAAMLDATCGPESGAPYTIVPPSRPYLEEVAATPQALRVGVSTVPWLGSEVHPDCVAAVDDARRLLESCGHLTLDVEVPVEREAFNHAFLTVICGEVAADLTDAELRTGRRPGRSDVESSTWALALLGRSLSAAESAKALRTLRRTARRVGRFFDGIDALLTPTVASPPFTIGALQPPPHERAMLRILGAMGSGRALRLAGVLEQAAEKVFAWIPYTPLFNVTGQPAMSLPLWWNAGGLPVGVQVVGRFGDEATLFQLAGQLEAVRPWRDRWPSLAAPA